MICVYITKNKKKKKKNWFHTLKTFARRVSYYFIGRFQFYRRIPCSQTSFDRTKFIILISTKNEERKKNQQFLHCNVNIFAQSNIFFVFFFFCVSHSFALLHRFVLFLCAFVCLFFFLVGGCLFFFFWKKKQNLCIRYLLCKSSAVEINYFAINN